MFPSFEFKLYAGLYSVPWLPNLILLPVGVKPVPVIVTCVPTGPDNGTSRVYRGGNGEQDAECCRSPSRGATFPDSGYRARGFRIVCKP